MTVPLIRADLTDETMADIRAAIDGIAERREQYDTAREYDSVNLWEAEQDSRQGRLLRQAGVEYDVNYSAPVINAVANGMVIESITARPDVELGSDQSERDDDRATALVNAIWRAQKLAQFWPTWQRNGLRDGDGYLMCWPVEDAADMGAFGLNDVLRRIRMAFMPDELNITYVDPTMGRLFYDEENPRIKKYYAQMWSVPVERDKVTWRLNLMYPDRIERYHTKPMGRTIEVKAENFMPYVDDLTDSESDEESEPGVIPNPFGVITVWHLRTETMYGRPVHENAYGPQDGIADTIERMMTTMAFRAWPQAWAIQEAEKLAQTLIREDPLAEDYHSGLDDFGDDLDRNTATSSVDASNEVGTDLEATPGGFMVLKGFKSVGQLDAADPTVFLEPWREFAKTAADTTDTPPWTFRATGAEIPSGVALKIASAPQTAKRARCAGLFGAELADLLAFAAELCGMPGLEVVIKWAPFEVVDETERWTLVKLRRDAGVPLKAALMMAGITEAEAEQWANEADRRADAEFERQQKLISKTPADEDPSVDE